MKDVKLEKNWLFKWNSQVWRTLIGGNISLAVSLSKQQWIPRFYKEEWKIKQTRESSIIAII